MLAAALRNTSISSTEDEMDYASRLCCQFPHLNVARLSSLIPSRMFSISDPKIALLFGLLKTSIRIYSMPVDAQPLHEYTMPPSTITTCPVM